MNFFNKIHTKFIIVSGLILALALISFTLVLGSYFEKTITQLTHEELERDLEYERLKEAPHMESTEVHEENTEEAPVHDESMEMGTDKDSHTDLTARVEEEKSIISQALSDIQKTAAWMALLAIIISSAIMYYISQRITRPITNLKNAAGEIGKGNLDTEIKIESSDEVGELAKAFKLMAVRIKEAYFNLQKEQAQLMASVNSLSLGFMMTDVQGKAIITNKVIQGMFNADDLTLENISKRLTTTINLSDYHRAIIENKTDYFTQEAAFADKFIKIFIAPVILKQVQEEVIGSVILIEDITQQKRLEESKTHFVAITAHELRTPISIIKGNAELLLGLPSKKLSDSEVKIKLEAIEKNSTRLLKIANDFLGLTVLEEKRPYFKNTRFDVVKITNEIVSDFKEKAAEKDLYIKVSTPPEPLPEVIADQDRTKEVIINILANSLQYTEKGGIALSFERSGDFIKVSVSDTGIGIKSDEQKKLFQKFHTVGDRFMHSKEYGSGMGLYISKLLMESMGGTIELEHSSLEVGSVFAILIPIKNPQLKPVNNLIR